MWIFRIRRVEDFHFPAVLQLLTSFCLLLLTAGLQAQNVPFSYDPESFLSKITYRANSLAIGDVNQDGFDDLVVGMAGLRPRAFMWSPSRGNFFQDGSADVSTRTFGAYGPITIVDVNGDGKNDVQVVSQTARDTSSISTWNDGTFRQLKRPARLVDFDVNARTHITYADFNNDGLLDLLLGRFLNTRHASNIVVLNFFARNNQPSIFDPNAEVMQQYAANSSNTFSDFNNDGFLDYLKINTANDRNRLFKGSINGFTALFDNTLNVSAPSFSALTLDFNNDGFMDIYRLNTNALGDGNARNVMYKNKGNFSFESIDAGAAVLEFKSSINASAGDIDNDGDLDIVVAESDDDIVSLYINLGNEKFSKTDLDIVGVRDDWYHAEFVDFDDNGKLDLITASVSGGNPFRFYRNNTPATNKWLKFDLSSSNTFFKEPTGARLVLETTIGGKVTKQTREILTSNGYLVNRSFVQHFGLGTATGPSTLTISWPSGLQQTLTIPSTDYNKKLKIVEPPSGKLTTVRTPTLSAASGSTVTDSIKIQNIGSIQVTISAVLSSGLGLTVTPSSAVISGGGTATFRVRYLALENESTGNTIKPVLFINNSIQDTHIVQVTTRNLGNRAPFSLASGTTDFYTGGDFHSAAIVAPLFSPMPDSVKQFISLSTNGVIRSFTQDTAFEFATLNPGAISLSPDGRKSAALGDVNRDGLIDVLIGQVNAPARLWLNEGAALSNAVGSFFLSSQRETFTVKLADFNRDSRLDPLILNGGNQFAELFYLLDDRLMPISAGDLTGKVLSTSGAAIVDLDSDDFPDLVIADAVSSTPIRYFSNQKNGSFTELPFPSQQTVSGRFGAVAATDFNNDGRWDLFLGSGNTATASQLWIQTENGTFSLVESPILEQMPRSVSDIGLIDFNLDGWEDVVFTYNQISVNNVMLMNLGGTALQQFLKGDVIEHELFSTAGVVITDANHDARPDVWFINSDYSNALFLNSTGSGPHHIAIRPWVVYPDGKKVLVPGTKITLSTTESSQFRQTRYIGFGSTRSAELNAAYFGTGSSTSGQIHVVYPDGTEVSREVSFHGGYEDVSITFTSGEKNPEKPASFALKAYPNPFNPSTSIQIDLPEAGDVNLTIYAITGQKITTLANRKMAAGRHIFSLNATGLSSGVYLCVLKTATTQKMLKLTLLK